MKPSEAIENIEYARRWMGCESDFSEEALDMAIAALEQQNRIITVTDAEGGLLASISDKDIIEENGVHVIISEE